MTACKSELHFETTCNSKQYHNFRICEITFCCWFTLAYFCKLSMSVLIGLRKMV